MNLEHLHYFHVLAETEHYGKAADILCISQPGLSHAIAALEEELGVPLFVKRGRGIGLTKYGRLLKEDSGRILTMIERMTEKFKTIEEGGGEIRLAGIINLTGMVLPGFVRDFREMTHSQGRFEFYTEFTPDIVQGVQEQKYDIGFCSYMEWGQSIEAVPFQKQPIVAVVGKNHPLAGKKEISLAEAVRYPQIVFAKKSVLHSVMESFFREKHLSMQVAYEVERDEVIAEMVACDFGMAVMPKLASVHRADLSVIPISDIEEENVFYMIRQKGIYHSKLEEDVWNFGKATFRGMK